MKLNIRKSIAILLSTAAIATGTVTLTTNEAKAQSQQVYDTETFDQGFNGVLYDPVELFNYGGVQILRSPNYAWMMSFANDVFVTGRVTTYSTEHGALSQDIQFDCSQRLYRDRGNVAFIWLDGQEGFYRHPVDASWKAWGDQTPMSISGDSFCDSARGSAVNAVRNASY